VVEPVSEGVDEEHAEAVRSESVEAKTSANEPRAFIKKTSKKTPPLIAEMKIIFNKLRRKEAGCPEVFGTPTRPNGAVTILEPATRPFGLGTRNQEVAHRALLDPVAAADGVLR
jgi:hypothetical protein